MIPCCCVCGKKAIAFDDPEWEYQDFCPKCAKSIMKDYNDILESNLYKRIES